MSDLFTNPKSAWDDPDLKPEVYNKLEAGETLEGEEAAAYLAETLAGETHGNYTGSTLHNRAQLHTSYEIRYSHPFRM